MIKTAIFVEGQAELIFVREMLLRVFDLSDLSFRCHKLLYSSDDNFFSADYDYDNVNAAFYFEIINVGNDTWVATQIIDKETLFWNKGYSRIIGLRDMYSARYLKMTGDKNISPELNHKSIEATNNQISERAIRKANIRFHFAIMEVEAWFLGLKDIFLRLGNDFTLDDIRNNLGFDLNAVDPETTFLHPTEQVKSIMRLIGKEYNKRKSDVEALMAPVTKQDFIDLRDSGKCASFASFWASIPNEEDFLTLMNPEN